MNVANKGELFELLNEADRLIKWWRTNREGWSGPLTLPRLWRGKPVSKILPEHMLKNGTYVHDGIPLKIQGDSGEPQAPRRIPRHYFDR